MRYLTLIALIVIGVWYFNSREADQFESDYGYEVERTTLGEKDCSSVEPDNPYTYEGGHYAGYEWAEEQGGGYCDGNSDSFNEGCEEYLQQVEAYDACVNR